MEWPDILFWGIVIGSWIFSSFSKKKGADNEPVARKGLILRALEFVARFKEGAVEDELQPHQQAVYEQVQLHGQQQEGVTAITSRTKEDRFEQTPRHRIKSSPEEPISEVSVQRRVRRKFAKQKMRQAIVWSEIIRPPVGLRDS